MALVGLGGACEKNWKAWVNKSWSRWVQCVGSPGTRVQRRTTSPTCPRCYPEPLPVGVPLVFHDCFVKEDWALALANFGVCFVLIKGVEISHFFLNALGLNGVLSSAHRGVVPLFALPSLPYHDGVGDNDDDDDGDRPHSGWRVRWLMLVYHGA